MINLGKDGSLEARRTATAWLPEPVIVEKLFSDLAKRYPDRSSGFLRITRLARRVGDNSKLMLVELMPAVDEAAAARAAEEKPRRRRLSLPRRGGTNPKATPAEEPATAKTAASTSKVKKASTASPKKKAPARATSRGAKASSSKEA